MFVYSFGKKNLGDHLSSCIKRDNFRSSKTSFEILGCERCSVSREKHTRELDLDEVSTVAHGDYIISRLHSHLCHREIWYHFVE